jgi:hypothetical protein
MVHPSASSKEKIIMSWLLPGETVQASFNGPVDLYPVNTQGDPLFSSSSRSLPSSNARVRDGQDGSATIPDRDSASLHVGRSHPYYNHHQQQQQQARLTPTGHLASLLTAAGRTLQGRLTQDTSTTSGGLPQHHIYPPQPPPQTTSMERRHQNQTHKHDTDGATGPKQQEQQAAVEKKGTSSSTSGAIAAAAGSDKPPQSTSLRLCITNFRVCLLCCLANGQSVIQQQIILGSIATMVLQDQNRMMMTLKFDVPRWMIAQHQEDSRHGHGPPMMVEIVSILKRLVFNDQVSSRFPYKMGKAILHPPPPVPPLIQQKNDVRWISSRSTVSSNSINTEGQKQVPLWTAEDIISLDDSSEENDSDGDGFHKATTIARKLGWSGGYDIMDEFRRLGFDELLWYVLFCFIFCRHFMMLPRDGAK